MSTIAGVDGLEVTGPLEDRFDEVLTPRALELVALLHRELDGRRLERLAVRQERVRALADGAGLGFLEETRSIREDNSDEEMKAISEARGDSFASGRWDDARAVPGDGSVRRVQRFPDPARLRADAVRTP